MFHDPETIRQCLLAGATGFVVKGANSSDLIDAIRAVSRGERYIHSSVVGLVVEDSLRWLRDGARLSRREHEVMSLLGGGRSPARIGEMLGISVHTVRRHLASATVKLGVQGTRAWLDTRASMGSHGHRAGPLGRRPGLAWGEEVRSRRAWEGDTGMRSIELCALSSTPDRAYN